MYHFKNMFYRFFTHSFCRCAGILFLFLLLHPAHANATELDDVLISEPTPLPQFKLVDHHKQAFTQDRMKGKWSLVFFGYTHCPDVCPVSLHEMDKLIAALPDKPEVINQFQFIFVSVDPERDTPDYLASYVNYFNPLLLGVTGEIEELKKLTSAVKIKFSKGDGTATDYTVNHSSAMLLIDPESRYYARFPAPHDVDRIYQWLREISHRTSMTFK